MENTIINFTQHLYKTYESYKVRELSSHKFKHQELWEIIHNHSQGLENILTIQNVGYSTEGRAINLLTLGNGKKKILMWSQMHGDEPTATMALLDILSYIKKNISTQEIQKILSETTLLIVPMLNPDGAERFQRQTVFSVDMNRDALQLSTPEAKILHSLQETYKPQFGFNLHDQDPRFTVGNTGNIATIALLAPAYNYEKSDNDVRTIAKKLSSEFYTILKQFIPENISRYDDSYEPRAFGDSMQRWGVSTVLIESGGRHNDPEKMYIRQLNCVALLGIFYSIALDNFHNADIDLYEQIPLNTKYFYDVIVRGVELKISNINSSIITDIGLMVEKEKYRVAEIGDLSMYSAFEEIDGKKKSVLSEKFFLNAVLAKEEKKIFIS